MTDYCSFWLFCWLTCVLQKHREWKLKQTQAIPWLTSTMLLLRQIQSGFPAKLLPLCVTTTPRGRLNFALWKSKETDGLGERRDLQWLENSDWSWISSGPWSRCKCQKRGWKTWGWCQGHNHSCCPQGVLHISSTPSLSETTSQWWCCTAEKKEHFHDATFT